MMHSTNKHEIIFNERYGSSDRKIIYMKSQEIKEIAILDKNRSNVSGWFKRVFLPQGYPESVSRDYTAYQIWDTAQAFCSTITGTLATQEVLRGVGVGNINTTPLAATITWVIKDGCGHLGRIFFAFSHGTHLDAYSKKWRLYADTLNDAAMCMEIALPIFSKYTTLVLCISTVMKAIVGVAGGATRAAMTQHHAIRNNLADVSAKDSAQETAVNLIASFTALFIISVFGNSILIFVLLMVLHIVFNYLAVRAVCLQTLNEPRFLQVIDTYLKHETILSPCVTNANEPIIFYQLGPNVLDLKLCRFQIKIGCSVKKYINEHSVEYIKKSFEKDYHQRSYILLPFLRQQKMFILVKENASNDDLLCAYFHAVLLSTIICAINDVKLPVYSKVLNPKPFAQVCHTLQAAEWSRDSATDTKSPGQFQYSPSLELLQFVDKIVQKEWLLLRSGLLQAGWDLSKHLLVLDEWRISNDTGMKYNNAEHNLTSQEHGLSNKKTK